MEGGFQDLNILTNDMVRDQVAEMAGALTRDRSPAAVLTRKPDHCDFIVGDVLQAAEKPRVIKVEELVTPSPRLDSLVACRGS